MLVYGWIIKKRNEAQQKEKNFQRCDSENGKNCISKTKSRVESRSTPLACFSSLFCAASPLLKVTFATFSFRFFIRNFLDAVSWAEKFLINSKTFIFSFFRAFRASSLCRFAEIFLEFYQRLTNSARFLWRTAVMLLLISASGIVLCMMEIYSALLKPFTISHLRQMRAFHPPMIRPPSSDIFNTPWNVDDEDYNMSTEFKHQPDDKIFEMQIHPIVKSSWTLSIMVHDKVYFLSEWTTRCVISHIRARDGSGKFRNVLSMSLTSHARINDV